MTDQNSQMTETEIVNAMFRHIIHLLVNMDTQ